MTTKKDYQDFKTFSKCFICDNTYVDGDVKVRDHCHIAGKHRGPARRYCNINVKLNHKIPIVFHRLKIYDSRFIMQEVGKFNLNTNVISNELKKYISFNTKNKLIFIEVPC